MLGFHALSEAALSDLLTGDAAVSGDGAVTLGVSVAADGSHGAAGDGAITLSISIDAAGEFQSIEIDGAGAVTLEITVAADGAHGVSGSGTLTLTLSEAADGAHGVAGGSTATIEITPAGAGAHGVAGMGAVTLSLAVAADAVHERYEVRGEVRLAGVLVNRRVRAYLRDSGELVGQGDTAAGRFSIHTGFAAAEHYLVPIDLAEAATDWAPPTANRIVSVLAQDA